MTYNNTLKDKIEKRVNNCTKVITHKYNIRLKRSSYNNIIFKECTFINDIENVIFKNCIFRNCIFKGNIFNTSFDNSYILESKFESEVITNSIYDAALILNTSFSPSTYRDITYIDTGLDHHTILFDKQRILFIQHGSYVWKYLFNEIDQIKSHINIDSLYGKMILSACEN